GARLLDDRGVRGVVLRGGRRARQVLAAPLGGGAAEALPGARERSVEALEAERRRLEESREAAALPGGAGGHARAHRPPTRAVAARRGGVEAVRAREGDRDGERRDRAGNARARVPGALAGFPVP